MNRYVHLIFISSDWEYFHRKRFYQTVFNKFRDWSDVVIVQYPLSITVNFVVKFKTKFIGYFTGKYKYKETKEGFKLYSPFMIFHPLFWYKLRLFRIIDSFFISQQINRLIEKRFINKKVIVWIYIPEQISVVKKINYDFLIYDFYDNYIYNDDGVFLQKKAIDNEEVIKKCDLILCTANAMFKQAKEYNENTIYLTNANNADDISFKFDENIKIELSDIKEPIIGYLGNVRNWIDFNLLEFILNKIPEAKLVLVGPVERNVKNIVKKLKKYDNLILTGNKPLESVPYYLKAFDIGIIPFRINKFTEGVFPYKFFEYLMASIPIVTTNLPDLKMYEDIIGYSETKEQFIQNCRAAISGEYEDKVKIYPKLALDNTWEKRVEVLENEFYKILDLKNQD